MVDFAVEQGNVLEISADLLLLKYAQGFFGADKAVAERLISTKICKREELRPEPGDFALMETRGAIPARFVLFLGTPSLHGFLYDEMEVFSRLAINMISELGLNVKTLTTTTHGPGYGLDGGEALQRLVRGFRQGLSLQRNSPIEKITFVALDNRTERILSAALEGCPTHEESPYVARFYNTIGQGGVSRFKGAAGSLKGESGEVRSPSPKTESTSKSRVFVAMPFSEEFHNVYEFGIYPAVRSCDLICERVDETHFTGDVLKRIREGIESADLVIADMTEGRPNVYLEVGYAWGMGVPVIFVARKGEDLHFDVSSHRCIYYGRFTKFAKELEILIRGIDISQKK